MDELENAEQQGQETPEVGLTDQAGEAQGGDSVAPAAPSMPEIEIERDGQVIKVPFDQAKDYVSKGYDYTQKTQELARERDSLKPYQEMATYLQSNPDKAQQIYQMLTNAGQDVDPVQQKLAHQEMILNQVIQQSSRRELDGMLDKIRGDEKFEGLFKDPDMEELLLAQALQTKRTDFEGLKSVATKIHKKILGVRVDSKKAGAQEVIKNLNSPTRKGESGTGSYAPPKGFDPAKASWKELNQRAVEML